MTKEEYLGLVRLEHPDAQLSDLSSHIQVKEKEACKYCDYKLYDKNCIKKCGKVVYYYWKQNI